MNGFKMKDDQHLHQEDSISRRFKVNKKTRRSLRTLKKRRNTRKKKRSANLSSIQNLINIQKERTDKLHLTDLTGTNSKNENIIRIKRMMMM